MVIRFIVLVSFNPFSAFHVAILSMYNLFFIVPMGCCILYCLMVSIIYFMFVICDSFLSHPFVDMKVLIRWTHLGKYSISSFSRSSLKLLQKAFPQGVACSMYCVITAQNWHDHFVMSSSVSWICSVILRCRLILLGIGDLIFVVFLPLIIVGILFEIVSPNILFSLSTFLSIFVFIIIPLLAVFSHFFCFVHGLSSDYVGLFTDFTLYYLFFIFDSLCALLWEWLWFSLSDSSDLSLTVAWICCCRCYYTTGTTIYIGRKTYARFTRTNALHRRVIVSCLISYGIDQTL